MYDFPKYMSNMFIVPCSRERKELLKMAVSRLLFQVPNVEETVADIFTENPNPCHF